MVPSRGRAAAERFRGALRAKALRHRSPKRSAAARPYGGRAMLTYEWVMSHSWMRHPYVWHDSSICVTWLIPLCDMDDVAIRTRHVIYRNESCRTYKWVMSHIEISHVAHRNESCHSYARVEHYEYVTEAVSHVTCINESCNTLEWVMSHTWTMHVTYMKKSCDAYGRVMWRIWMIRVA